MQLVTQLSDGTDLTEYKHTQKIDVLCTLQNTT